MSNVIESNDVSKMLAEFQAKQESGEMFIVIFTGGAHPETGASWCGDCVTAKPMMKRVMDKQTEMPILVCVL